MGLIPPGIPSISKSVAIAAALAVIVVILGLYAIMLVAENAGLKSEIYELRVNLQELKSKYNSLSSSYNQLYDTYNELKSSYNQLLEAYQQLQDEYEALKEEYSSKVTELEQLRKKYEELSRQILVAQIPKGYYEVDFIPDRFDTFENLQDFLLREFTMPRGYRRGTFDCSEMSAYLEWVLEDAGFDAKIAVGPCPWNPSLGYHAWVIVYTRDGYVVAIEPTALMTKDDPLYIKVMKAIGMYLGKDGIIYSGNPYENGYYRGFEALYDTIYDAVAAFGGIEEWDWWLGYWGFKD